MESQMQFLEDFTGESDEEKVFSSAAKRIRGLNRNWVKFKDFPNEEEAENEVKNERIWSKSSSKKTHAGFRVDYRCNNGTYRHNECPVAIYLLYHASSSRVTMYKTDATHQHDNDDQKRGLSNEIKNYIINKFEDGIIKPNAIMAAMRRDNMMEADKNKVKYFLDRLRRDKFEHYSISMHKLLKWCEENVKIPDDEDQSFILCHHITWEFLHSERNNFKIFITTKRLLKNIQNSVLVQIDSTNKLEWQGYPVITIGTSDANQIFHPFGLCLCESETMLDFEFIFKSIQKNHPNWKPKILLADGNDNIIQAYDNIFGTPEVRLVCFSHVLQSIDIYLKHLVEKEAIVKDIKSLQLCVDSVIFKKASDLFFRKWEIYENLKEFLKYFKDQWTDRHEYWFEGAAIRYPSTNSGIESSNNNVRKNRVLRERLPEEQFFKIIFKIVGDWSNERNPQYPNKIEFATVRSTTLKEWKEAYCWALSNKKIVKEETESHFLYYTNSTETDETCITDLKKIFQDNFANWNSFDSFIELYFSVWIISFDKSDSNLSYCTCPFFLKCYSCKHLLGIQIRCRLVDVPEEAKINPLGKKRGRPKKAQTIH